MVIVVLRESHEPMPSGDASLVAGSDEGRHVSKHPGSPHPSQNAFVPTEELIRQHGIKPLASLDVLAGEDPSAPTRSTPSSSRTSTPPGTGTRDRRRPRRRCRVCSAMPQARRADRPSAPRAGARGHVRHHRRADEVDAGTPMGTAQRRTLRSFLDSMLILPYDTRVAARWRELQAYAPLRGRPRPRQRHVDRRLLPGTRATARDLQHQGLRRLR
jgi:hypothetical protein